jgi:hypothetical protein
MQSSSVREIDRGAASLGPSDHQRAAADAKGYTKGGCRGQDQPFRHSHSS